MLDGAMHSLAAHGSARRRVGDAEQVLERYLAEQPMNVAACEGERVSPGKPPTKWEVSKAIPLFLLAG
jgi:hypothetical protein